MWFRHPNVYIFTKWRLGKQFHLPKRWSSSKFALVSWKSRKAQTQGLKTKQSLKASPPLLFYPGKRSWRPPARWVTQMAGWQAVRSHLATWPARKVCLHLWQIDWTFALFAGCCTYSGFSLEEGQLSHPLLELTMTKNTERQTRFCKCSQRETFSSTGLILGDLLLGLIWLYCMIYK